MFPPFHWLLHLLFYCSRIPKKNTLFPIVQFLSAAHALQIADQKDSFTSLLVFSFIFTMFWFHPDFSQTSIHWSVCQDISRYTLLSTNYLKQLTKYVSRSFVSLLIVKLFKPPRSKNYVLLLPVVSAGYVGNQIRIKSELEFKPLLQNKIKCTCSPNTKAPITSENRRVMLFRKQKIFCKLAKVTRESESVSCSAISDSETLWTVAYQAPLSMRFSRQEYWRGLPFPPPPGDLSNPGIEPGSPVLQADCLLPEP